MHSKRKLNELLSSLDHPKSSLMLQSIENKKIIYAPWSRSQFSKRLSTFWSFPYHSINSPFNAVAWAKHGWTCTGQTTVQCELCRQQVELKMEVEAQLDESETIALQIETAHAENCSWRKKSCDESIMKLPLSDGKMAIEAFNERTKKLDTFKELPKRLEVPEDMKKDLVKKNTEILSIFGWSGLEVDGILLLVCTACHRRIGPWNFELEKKKGFDVIFEHRNYCPWINSTSQISVDPGWKILSNWLLHLSKSKPLNIKDSLDIRLERLRTTLGLKKV
ncbi:hypothetical protein PNEG_03410 [Pneumocystis murina B123]|uniref:C3HC-type domain-containing protein n=1 Tax=Pneumocystis murina (strain B123) TaxID=1069680 RepID=M7NI61_PNEMU|nr:hypothetical protein PNEG_03410 [Pneumocystis murina B123]EMR08243.1 hypothetical protein PNEG_03410 [Pneumocystis murina B123]